MSNKKYIHMKNLILSFSISFVIFSAYSQKFAVVGDQRGATIATQQVSVLVNSFNPEFIVTTGDNFDLTQGTLDSQVGQYFHNYIFPYLGTYGAGDTINRFFPALGNHELSANGLTEYLSYFSLPGNERYYDFVKGNVHFFIINSNTNEIDGTDTSSIQAQWLKTNLLTSVERWNIVCIHHSPYSSSSHGNNSWMNWPYQEWGATAVFAGHDHVYERIMKNEFPYFVNGAGGAGLYPFNNPVPGSIVRYNLKNGAQLISAYADSISFRFYNVDSELIDYYTIISLNDNLKNNQQWYLNAYKNNNSIYINYNVKMPSNVSFEVYDISGSLLTSTANTYKLSGSYVEKATSNLQSGIYIVCLKINNNIVCSRKILF